MHSIIQNSKYIDIYTYELIYLEIYISNSIKTGCQTIDILMHSQGIFIRIYLLRGTIFLIIIQVCSSIRFIAFAIHFAVNPDK